VLRYCSLLCLPVLIHGVNGDHTPVQKGCTRDGAAYIRDVYVQTYVLQVAERQRQENEKRERGMRAPIATVDNVYSSALMVWCCCLCWCCRGA